MRKLLMAAVALAGLTGLSATGAVAAPFAAATHTARPQSHVTSVGYYYNHHTYHHRRFEHGHWRYWD